MPMPAPTSLTMALTVRAPAVAFTFQVWLAASRRETSEAMVWEPDPACTVMPPELMLSKLGPLMLMAPEAAVPVPVKVRLPI